MQGLWSTHSRRAKVNLNSAPIPASGTATSVVQPPAEVQSSDAQPDTPLGTPAETEPVATLGESKPVSTKRKLRSTREEGSKRAKLSSAVAKDYSPPSTRLSDLGGVDVCIEKMLELVAMPLCHPEIYLHTGVQPPRGVLLHGPPGCGKTMLAHAIAGVRRRVSSVTLHPPHKPRRNLVCRSSTYLPPPSYLACPASPRRHFVTRSRRRRG